KVEKYVGKHAQRSIAGGGVVFVAEDGGECLGRGGVLCGLYVWFGFCGHVGLQGSYSFLFPGHLRTVVGVGAAAPIFTILAVAVITAAMTRTLELVFAWLPIRSAAQVRAACVNDEYPVRSSIHPNAIFLLKFSVNAQSKIGGVADFKDCAGLKQCARQEEPEE